MSYNSSRILITNVGKGSEPLLNYVLTLIVFLLVLSPPLGSLILASSMNAPLVIPLPTVTPQAALNDRAATQPNNVADTTAAQVCADPSPTASLAFVDGVAAASTTDNLLDASWRQSIDLDLASEQTICSMEVTWQPSIPNTRHNFVISTSSDGTTFTEVFSSETSGLAGIEKYVMPANTAGQYVRLALSGSDTTIWTSVQQITVFGPSTVEPSTDFNFGLAGDFANGQNAINTFNSMASKNVELAIGLGDYAYTTGQSAVDSWYQKITNAGISDKWYGTLGNHDVSDSARYDNKFLNQNGFVYSWNYQNVHFLSVNSETSVSPGSSQYTFVRNDLQTAHDDPNIKWIVAFMHRPMYASCSTHCPESSIRNALHPLFDQYGVDLVVNAHDHNYQRNYPLKFGTGDNPIITSTETRDYIIPEGQVYVGVGTGGQSSYSLNTAKPYTLKQFTGSFGFLDINIINDGTELVGDYYDNSNTAGKTDHFTITKTGAAPPPANQPPTADSKSVTTTMDTPIGVTLSGQDPEGGPLTFSIVDQPADGMLGSTITPQGVITYTPNTGYTGADSFTYVSRDNQGATSSKATVSITVSPPIRDDPESIGAFFYPWYGLWRHWQDNGHNPPTTWASNYLPQIYNTFDVSQNLYDSSNSQTINTQIGLMKQAGIEFGISSWWGQNSYEDQTFEKIIAQPDNIKWTVLYENEGFGDPSVSQIVSDLNYIKSKYATSENYLYKDGKPVIFVYNAAHPGYNPIDDLARWMDAKEQAGFYVVFKVDPLGAGADPNSMDSWYQYAPTKYFEKQGTWSAFVSPGFDKYHEGAPRLPRDVTQFANAVGQLKNAQVDWKLVETWNEWGEGTGIEPSVPIIHDDAAGFRPVPTTDGFLEAFTNGMQP